MCIIIAGRASAIRNSWLRQSFNSNPDGAGITYHWKNQNVITKGLMTLGEFMREWRRVKSLLSGSVNENVIIHCRIATHGKVCKQLTQPFLLGTGISFAHNGIIHGGIYDKLPRNGKWSDSKLFAVNVVNNSWRHGIKELDKELKAHAKSSRFAVMDLTGTIFVYGHFHQYKNCYFSNESYIPWTPPRVKYTWTPPVKKDGWMDHYNYNYTFCDSESDRSMESREFIDFVTDVYRYSEFSLLRDLTMEDLYYHWKQTESYS